VANDYKIGTSIGNMLSLSTLGINDPDPVPVQYSEYLDQGDANILGAGCLRAEWRFAIIEIDEVRALRAYCPEPSCSSTVYIKTVKTTGGFGVYQAIMVWPQTEPAYEADAYEDFIIEFRMLAEAAT
jgi:hypothetical protein